MRTNHRLEASRPGQDQEVVAVALLLRAAMAQQVLTRELVDVLQQAGLVDMHLVLADGLRPGACRADPERVTPPRRFSTPSATANISEVQPDTAALRQDLKLLVGDLAANRYPGRNDRFCPGRASRDFLAGNSRS